MVVCFELIFAQYNNSHLVQMSSALDFGLVSNHPQFQLASQPLMLYAQYVDAQRIGCMILSDFSCDDANLRMNMNLTNVAGVYVVVISNAVADDEDAYSDDTSVLLER